MKKKPCTRTRKWLSGGGTDPRWWLAKRMAPWMSYNGREEGGQGWKMVKNGERSGWYGMSKGESARQLDVPPLGSFYACCKLGLQVMVGLGNFFG